MMRTEAESSDLDEREQSLEMSWSSSLDSLGINTNYSLEVSVNSEKRVYGENVVSTLTLRWIDDTTEQEVKPYHTTPRMQASAEAQIVVLKEIFQVYLPGFQENIISYIQGNTYAKSLSSFNEIIFGTNKYVCISQLTCCNEYVGSISSIQVWRESHWPPFTSKSLRVLRLEIATLFSSTLRAVGSSWSYCGASNLWPSERLSQSLP